MSESDVPKKEDRSGKDLTQDLRDAFDLFKNSFHGRVDVKKPFFRKGNREKRLSYAK